MSTIHTIANSELLGEICALLTEGKRVKIRAKGDSMHPFIRGDEDIIVLAPVPEKLRKGDIVLARIAGGDYVIHRIVNKSADRLVLAGDGNLFRRETCRLRDVGGIAVALIRNCGERSLTSHRARIAASVRLSTLPVRRLAWLILNKITNLLK